MPALNAPDARAESLPPEEFARLWERSLPNVRGVVGAVMRRDADIEDVLQDTWVYLYTSRWQYIPGTSFPAWAIKTGVRRAINAKRKRDRREIGEDPPEASAPDPAFAEIVERHGRGDLDELLRLAMRGGQEGVREAIMCYLGEMTQRDVSEALGLPLTTVKGRVFRGLRVLRRTAETHGLLVEL